MNKNGKAMTYDTILRGRPQAWAVIRGSTLYPELIGTARFYGVPGQGTLVAIEVYGLPDPGRYCESPVFACHIHEGGSCTGNTDDPFADTGTHYNPGGCPHPYHAGDVPPLFGVDGHAYSVFLTNRFTVSEVIGKTVIIHSSPDDFMTQPSGNSGIKIACGEIVGRIR